MWLAFAVDEEAAVYFVEVISGPRAYSMAVWMRNETVEEHSITLYDIPVIVFSGHEADTFSFQNASWLRANLVLNKSIEQKWVWSDTVTMMPELVVKTVRSFHLKVNLSIIYSCKRLLIGGVPLLDAEFNQSRRRYTILQAHVVNIVPVNQPARHKDAPNADPFSNMPPPGPSTA